uniref:Uncharacterized protein n=1 Tax=Plectus sambesii TaxID=2011161 RepID=A0A914X3E8_9BILA
MVRGVATQQLPYAHAKTGGFTQDAPTLHNPFDDDPLLEKVLRRWLPQQAYDAVAADLHAFGERVVSELNTLGRECDVHPPQLEQHDAWGRRVDRLVLTPAWGQLKQIAAQEGLIAIGYERKHGQWSRLHQFAKLYLFSPSAGLTTCPLAMTDGAAKTLEALSLAKREGITAEAFQRLTSRDPKKYWTSGQWMTEKKGGSDVGSGCDTLAVRQDDGSFRLSGYKWFSSATDADMALTLARVVDDQGDGVKGSKGLSLFLVRLRDAETNALNGIQIMKLKNKLGTKQVPTAELLLDETVATKLSDDGRGVPAIANMLNITRMHNAVASVSSMR